MRRNSPSGCGGDVLAEVLENIPRSAVALATLEALVVPPQYGGSAVLALCAVVVIGALVLALRASRHAAALQRNARLK